MAQTSRARRYFAAVQALKAVVGLVLSIGFIAVAGPPDALAAIALGGLVLPGILAALTVFRIPLEALELSGLGAFAVLIAYLVAATGGVSSPFAIWFALVPAEAALASGKRAVRRATVATLVALAVFVLCAAGDLLPASRLPADGWMVWGISVGLAVLQGAWIAAVARQRQRVARQSIVDSAAMYRFLSDNAMDLITRHAADGRILYANPAAEALIGMAPQALKGVPFAALSHPDDVKALNAAFMEASYFSRPASAEIRLRRADGSYVWAEMSCRPAPSGEGEGIVAVTRDLTHRKAYERDLIAARDLAEEASRAKSRFLANMSHELRTPLNAVIGFSEVMTHEMFGPLGAPRYLEYARLINESGGHLLELINDLLDMSKIEAGKFEISEEIFDVRDVSEASLRFVKMAAERGRVALYLDVADDVKQIFADLRAVKQIMVNLLSNGVKFTPSGGAVRLSVRRIGAGIEIAVSDSGVGITSEDAARLGKPFEQVESGRARTRQGTGLGLALVTALAAMHGGEMKLESALGEGTKVRVTLPHAVAGDQAAAV